MARGDEEPPGERPPERPPEYKRYRARAPLLGRGRSGEGGLGGRGRGPGGPGAPGGGVRERLHLPARRAPRAPGQGWRRWTSPGRLALLLAGFVVFWLVLSAVLFLISSHFERTSPPADVGRVLDSAGSPLFSANTILVLGSDTRQKNSREPGAEKTGPGRSDTIMLIRTGGGHSARLSIPRDTFVEIPGHGMQKINAAHAFGGPRESIEVIKRWLGIPINHLVEVNFENFPQLIDAMGGVDYTGGCIYSELDGGFRNGGYTLRLKRGTHHINGKQALAIARTRENKCALAENDINREEHQQALFNAMKGRLLSVSSFFRLPLIAWNAPPAIISDMGGATLLQLFGGMAFSGTPATHVLRGTPVVLSGLGDGQTVTESAKRRAVDEFMNG